MFLAVIKRLISAAQSLKIKNCRTTDIYDENTNFKIVIYFNFGSVSSQDQERKKHGKLCYRFTINVNLCHFEIIQ